MENGEALGTLITRRVHEVDKRWVVPNYNYMRVSFLNQEHLKSCLPVERSMMKSSRLFECGPLPSVHLVSTRRPPDVIHVISVPKPSPFFTAVLLPYCEHESKKKKMGEAWLLYMLDLFT